VTRTLAYLLNLGLDPELGRLIDRVQAREVDPLTAVAEIVEQVFGIDADAR